MPESAVETDSTLVNTRGFHIFPSISQMSERILLICASSASIMRFGLTILAI
jgi:hypothetical protein